MRVLFILILILALPVLEGWLLFRLGERFGGWVLVWLALAAIAGLALIRMEKLVWAWRIAGSLREQRSPLPALLASVRSVAAGLLLLFPGLITDVAALLLLLWPLPKSARPEGMRGPDVIEGEYRRERGADRLPPRS